MHARAGSVQDTKCRQPPSTNGAGASDAVNGAQRLPGPAPIQVLYRLASVGVSPCILHALPAPMLMACALRCACSMNMVMRHIQVMRQVRVVCFAFCVRMRTWWAQQSRRRLMTRTREMPGTTGAGGSPMRWRTPTGCPSPQRSRLKVCIGCQLRKPVLSLADGPWSKPPLGRRVAWHC